MKRFHIALGVADVEASADDYSQQVIPAGLHTVLMRRL